MTDPFIRYNCKTTQLADGQQTINSDPDSPPQIAIMALPSRPVDLPRVRTLPSDAAQNHRRKDRRVRYDLAGRVILRAVPPFGQFPPQQFVRRQYPAPVSEDRTAILRADLPREGVHIAHNPPFERDHRHSLPRQFIPVDGGVGRVREDIQTFEVLQN